jgi:hypothetical protein
MRRLVAHPAGPTIVAVVLAMVSWPMVALEMSAVQAPFESYSPPELSGADPARWTAALGAVLASALVAGTFGGWLRRERMWLEATAFLVAWLVGIAAAPVLPALLGQKIGFGSVCIDACWVPENSGDLGSVAAGVILFPLAAMVESGPFGILLVGFLIWLFIVWHFGPAYGPASFKRVRPPYPPYQPPYQRFTGYAAPQPWPTAPYPAALPAPPSAAPQPWPTAPPASPTPPLGQQQLPQPTRSDGQTDGAHRE